MKISRVLAVSAVVACMVTTTSFAAGVSNQTSETQGQKPSIQRDFKDFGGRGMHGGMDRGRFKGAGGFGQHENPMDSLVTAGTITQAQEDAIQKAMEAARDSGKTMKETLDSLVTAGTITQVQEDAIIKAMPARDEKGGFGGRGGFDGQHKNPMDALVTAGTITKVQEDAIQTAMKPAKDSHKTMKETLDSLVAAGTITQVQEDAIIKAMPVKDEKGGFGGRGGFDGQHKNPMDSLVTAGTITKAQEDAIQTAMKPAKDSHKTMKETLDSLVTAGTITQAQEDAVTNMVPHAPKK